MYARVYHGRASVKHADGPAFGRQVVSRVHNASRRTPIPPVQYPDHRKLLQPNGIPAIHIPPISAYHAAGQAPQDPVVVGVVASRAGAGCSGHEERGQQRPVRAAGRRMTSSAALPREYRPQIVLLLGPTGVGKTTLVEALERRFGPPDPLILRMTCLPVAGRRGYDFRRMHWRLLAQASDDRFYDDHVSPDAAGARLRSGRVRRDGPATTDEYRVGVLAMLRERGARAVVLDKAPYIDPRAQCPLSG